MVKVCFLPVPFTRLVYIIVYVYNIYILMDCHDYLKCYVCGHASLCSCHYMGDKSWGSRAKTFHGNFLARSESNPHSLPWYHGTTPLLEVKWSNQSQPEEAGRRWKIMLAPGSFRQASQNRSSTGYSTTCTSMTFGKTTSHSGKSMFVQEFWIDI